MIVAYDSVRYPGEPYTIRREQLKQDYDLKDDPDWVNEVVKGGRYHVKVVLCPQVEVRSLEEIYTEEARLLALGFEGGIVRRPHMPYKNGRSTALGGQLTKVKRRESYDAQVIGYEEGEQNTNAAETSALGYTKRSTHKEGRIPNGRLGFLVIQWVNGPYKGKSQKVGVFRGLTHSDLVALLAERENLLGRYCEVSVDPMSGGYDVGRTPVWLKWRPKEEF